MSEPSTHSMTYEFYDRRVNEIKTRLQPLLDWQPRPQERRLPYDVSARARRAKRALSQAEHIRAKIGGPVTFDRDFPRAFQKLNEAEREIELGEELMRELSK